MLSLLGSLIGIVPAIERIGGKIADAQMAKAQALTDRERIKADESLKTLEMQRDVLIAEQANASTRWVRPAICFPFVVYLWKIIIFDVVLGMGRTDALNDDLTQTMAIIIGAFFISRPIEKIGQAIAARKAHR